VEVELLLTAPCLPKCKALRSRRDGAEAPADASPAPEQAAAASPAPREPRCWKAQQPGFREKNTPPQPLAAKADEEDPSE